MGNVYSLGRFRLSLTRVARPIGLGVPEEFRTYLATVPELRSQAQRETLVNYFHSIDTEWRTKARRTERQPCTPAHRR